MFFFWYCLIKMELRLRVTLKDLSPPKKMKKKCGMSLLLNYTAEVKSGTSHVEEKQKAKLLKLMS